MRGEEEKWEKGGVGGGRNWMRSRRPRGVDLDCRDLTAEAQQMRCVCGYFCTQDACGYSKECVDVCETKTDKRE